MVSTFLMLYPNPSVNRTPPTIVAIEILCPVDGNFLSFSFFNFAADL